MEFIGHGFRSFDEVFNFSLYYGNGRLLGNILGVSLVYSRLACSIIKAIAISSSVALLPKVLGIKCFSMYIASFILFAGCSAKMFGQIYISVCAFSNYVIPIWLTLLIIYLIRFKLNTENRFNTTIITAAICILGVSSQLFAEHSTIVNFLLSVIIAIHAVKVKKGHIQSICYALSTSIGAVLMFAIPRIFYVAGNRTEGYRSINLNDIPSVFQSASEAYIRIKDWIFDSYFFIGTGCLIVFITVYVNVNLKRKKSLRRMFLLSIVLLCSYYYCRCFLLDIESFSVIKRIREYLDALFIISILILFLYCIYSLLCVKLFSLESVLLILCSVSILPFFVVTPVRERCFFQAYVFMIALFLIWMDRGIKNDDLGSTISLTSIGIAFSLSCVLIISSFSLRWLDSIRTKHILQEMKSGSDTIEVFTIESDYESSDNSLFYGKQYYYHEWNDIHFETIEQDDWLIKYR